MTEALKQASAILKAAEEATPGPWHSHGRLSAGQFMAGDTSNPYAYEIRTDDPDPSSKYEWPQRICETIMGQSGPGDEPNFAFIALARNTAPAIALALIEKHRALEECMGLLKAILQCAENGDGLWDIAGFEDDSPYASDFLLKAIADARALLARQGATA